MSDHTMPPGPPGSSWDDDDGDDTGSIDNWTDWDDQGEQVEAVADPTGSRSRRWRKVERPVAVPSPAPVMS